MTAILRNPPAFAPDDRAAESLAFFAGLAAEWAGSGDRTARLCAVLAQAAEVLGCSGAAVFMIRDEGGPLVRIAAHGSVDSLEASRGSGRDAVAACLARNKVQCLYGDPNRSDPRSVRALFCAPIGFGGRPFGVLAVVNDYRGTIQTPDPRFVCVLAGWMALALSHDRLTRDLARHEGVNRELDLAAEIQRNLLPRVDPASLPVYGLNRPIRRVSGDFFDFFKLDDGHIPFALGDVSGKGMNAALLMAKAASLFRCLAKRDADPAALLRTINDEICETATHGMFVTMVAGTYDPERGRLCFANAGHEPPLLRTPDREYRSFPASTPPLGILRQISFEVQEVEMDGGEFFIFSDGLTEYRYGDREALGVEGLIQLVESRAELPLYERMDALLAELDCEGWESRDDLTVLAIDDAWVRSHG